MTLDIDDYNIESWTVTEDIADALRVLSGQIDKHDVPEFFEKIKATARDHNNIPHTVFAGIIPDVDYALASAANKALLTGYDYAWYLTVQYVPADDRTTDIDTNPSETIETLLGGTSWGTVTGIEPHRINTVADWANIKNVFEFGEKCTRWKAIAEVCEHCHFVFVIKWNDALTPQAYFVHEDDIDSDTAGIDLPAMVTITNPDPYLLDGVMVKDNPEHQYNRVKATGYDASTQTNLYATAQTPEVAAGTELAIEYAYGDTSLDTQAKTAVRAQELLDFFQASAKVYTARFKQRMDLELYQKIEFSGYQKIEQEEMRITRISYSRAAHDDTVEIEFSKDQAVQQLKRLARAVNPDYVSGQQELIEDDLADIGLTDVFTAPADVGLWHSPGAATRLKNPERIILEADLEFEGNHFLEWSIDDLLVGQIYGFHGAEQADFIIKSKNNNVLTLESASGAIDCSSGRLSNVGSPVGVNDATNKTWVQSAISSGNVDSVSGWKFHGLTGSVQTVPNGWSWHWTWTLPYTGTKMKVIPNIVVHSEFDWYQYLSVFVMKQNFGTNGIDIMLHNGSGHSLSLSIEALVMWY